MPHQLQHVKVDKGHARPHKQREARAKPTIIAKFRRSNYQMTSSDLKQQMDSAFQRVLPRSQDLPPEA